ncbi:LOG family protein [bacterium]|nr:LOG family protein [bacterium]
MPKNTFATPYDLISPDGKITKIMDRKEKALQVEVSIFDIHENFVGFVIDREDITFNIKSTFAQLGISSTIVELELSKTNYLAKVILTLYSFNEIGKNLLALLTEGIFVGKLFAKDPRRIIRSSDYLNRLFGKVDHNGDPLLILSEEYKKEEIIDDSEKHRVLVRIPLRPGHFVYDKHILGFLPTVVKGLQENKPSFRKFLYLHQEVVEGERVIPNEDFLLVKTTKMSVRTLFSRVAHDALPEGFCHASADILQPQMTSGDIFEFHAKDPKNSPTSEITHIPLEFYSLEPYREFFFFCDKELLREDLGKKEVVFNALDTAPAVDNAATFIVKKFQLKELSPKNWIAADPELHSSLPTFPKTREERAIVSEYIERQAEYPILKSMQEGYITSQGILLSKNFTSNLLSNFLLNEHVARCLKGIYFLCPSNTHGNYFSHDDRSMLRNLAKQNIDVFWADKDTDLLLKYVPRKDMDTGLFVPFDKVKDYENATIFGVYGSRFEITSYENELRQLFSGLIEMKERVDHDLFQKEHSIAIATGGGPGIMAMGNRIASELDLLSIGHAVDFRRPHEDNDVNEAMNHYIQGRMTYRLEQVIIRQSEFGLDFPIFFEGGIGTDFEFALELLRIQVGSKKTAPIILFGDPKYYQAKISKAHQENLKRGTIKGSEWIPNCFYCVQNHKQALSIYYKFFTGSLEIGKQHKGSSDGFFICG